MTIFTEEDDPVDNLEGVICDIQAGQANGVCVETLRRVQGQIKEMECMLIEDAKWRAEQNRDKDLQELIRYNDTVIEENRRLSAELDRLKRHRHEVRL